MRSWATAAGSRARVVRPPTRGSMLNRCARWPHTTCSAFDSSGPRATGRRRGTSPPPAGVVIDRSVRPSREQAARDAWAQSRCGALRTFRTASIATGRQYMIAFVGLYASPWKWSRRQASLAPGSCTRLSCARVCGAPDRTACSTATHRLGVGWALPGRSQFQLPPRRQVLEETGPQAIDLLVRGVGFSRQDVEHRANPWILSVGVAGIASPLGADCGCRGRPCLQTPVPPSPVVPPEAEQRVRASIVTRPTVGGSPDAASVAP